MSPLATASHARLSIEAVLDLLAGADILATRDAGALILDPMGVLVGLPTLASRTLGGVIYTVPVTVISGDPLSTPLAVDRLYALADDAAFACRVETYSPSTFSNGVNAEPLPALELVVTVTLSNGG